MSTTTTESGLGELYAQWARMFESSMKSAAMIQEESARWLAGVADGMSSPQAWQKRSREVMQQTMAVAQKNLEEASRLMVHNANAGMELLEKACNGRVAENGAEAQARTQAVMESALGTLRSNDQAVVQANSRLVESWAEAARIMTCQGEEKPAGEAH